MQLKDVLDMHDYLTDRCYCPGEIYDQSSKDRGRRDKV